MPENTGYALAGFSGFLLFGHFLQAVGWHVLFVKLVLFVLILLGAFAAFVILGNKYQSHAVGYLSGFAVLFLGLIVLGIS